MEEVNDNDGWLRIDKWVVIYLANSQIWEAEPNRAPNTLFMVDFAFNRIWTSGHICIEPGENTRRVRKGEGSGQSAKRGN